MEEKQFFELPEKVRVHFKRSETLDPSLRDKHFHNVFELIHVFSGTGSYTVEGTQYDMHPDSLVIFRPGEFHYVSPDVSSPYERCVIHFAGDAFGDDSAHILREFTKIPFGHGIFYAATELTPDVRQLFRRLREAATQTDEKSAILVRMIVGEILLSLSSLPPVPPDKSDAVGARAIRYLGAHITEPLSLDRLAHELLISKYHLCRAFKEYNGITISSYLMQKRVLLAKEKLTGGMKPREAAYAVGFDDYSSFFRAYKKITGHAPKEDLCR